MLKKPLTRITALTALLLAVLVSTASHAEQPTQVKVTTNLGEFVIEVNSERAPLTAANFLRYVREGFYSNTLFHRVVPNFVIQGGGHDATTLQLKPTHENIFNESGNGLQNKRGAVGVARAEGPHSGNCQFYIDLADNPDLDPLPTRWGYAVFGRVIEGMDVLDRISVVATGAVGPFKSDAPLKAVVIEKAEILDASAQVSTEKQSLSSPSTPVQSPR